MFRILNVKIPSETWVKIPAGTVSLNRGANHLKWLVIKAQVDLDWIDVTTGNGSVLSSDEPDESSGFNGQRTNYSLAFRRRGPDYLLQTATDWISWATISTSTPSVFPFYWTDTNSVAAQFRFYRVKLGP